MKYDSHPESPARNLLMYNITQNFINILPLSPSKTMRILPTELTEAIRLQKEGNVSQSRDILADYLINKSFGTESLLWLAKVSSNPHEAINAAELAFMLDPENEIAKRAVTTVSKKLTAQGSRQVELDLLKLTGMTAGQARAVIWPFRNLHRPLGILLDEKAIEFKDLAWAIQNVKEDLIRQACRTLLLVQIFQDKVAEPPKPLRVIKGRENLEFQERISSLKVGFYFGILITIAVLLLTLDILNRIYHFKGLEWAGLAGLLAIFILIPLGQAANKSADEMLHYKTGRIGEAKMVDLFRATLQSPWVLFHSFEYVERKWGDIDLVLVGPGGVWVFEVKAYSSKTRVIGEKWQYRSRFGWRNMAKNPGKQAQRNAMGMRDYLESHDLRVRWVQPVVLWAGEDDDIQIEDPVVPVWRLGDLETRIEDLWRQQKLADDQLQPIVALLENTIERVKAKIKK